MALFLMHCNTPVARSNSGHYGDWTILNERMLPMGLKKRLENALVFDMEAPIAPSIPAFSAGIKITREYIQEAMKTGKTDEATALLQYAQESVDYERARADFTVQYEKHKAVQSDLLLSWLSERVLPAGRRNYKVICQHLNLEAPQLSREAKANISKLIRGQSITDNYWIADNADKPPAWSKIAWRKSKLRNGLAVVALTGTQSLMTPVDYAEELQLLQKAPKRGIVVENVCLQGTPEAMLHGAYEKAVFREENGELWLYKTDRNSNYTVLAEVAVSRILDCSNVRHVDYTLATKNTFLKWLRPGASFDYRVVKCKLMTTDDYEIIHAYEAATNQNEMLGYISKYRQQYAQMIVTDFLVGNRDRHGRNWGFQRESSKNWEVTGLHPQYDHNEAFMLPDYLAQTPLISTLEQGLTLEQAAFKHRTTSNLKFHKPIPFKTTFGLFGKYADALCIEFERRCKLLNISVQVKR